MQKQQQLQESSSSSSSSSSGTTNLSISAPPPLGSIRSAYKLPQSNNNKNNHNNNHEMVLNHISYGIRTDMVQTINARILELLLHPNIATSTSTTEASLAFDFATSPLYPSMVENWRTNGVRSFWPAHASDVECNRDCQRRGQYRCLVSHTLLEHLTADAVERRRRMMTTMMTNHSHNKTNHNNNNNNNNNNRTTTTISIRSISTTSPSPLVKVGFAGDIGISGRTMLQMAYVHELLSYKIIVVCQRDVWEGHYRLMEAMSGGGLVLHDVMLTPPSQ